MSLPCCHSDLHCWDHRCLRFDIHCRAEDWEGPSAALPPRHRRRSHFVSPQWNSLPTKTRAGLLVRPTAASRPGPGASRPASAASLPASAWTASSSARPSAAPAPAPPPRPWPGTATLCCRRRTGRARTCGEEDGRKRRETRGRGEGAGRRAARVAGRRAVLTRSGLGSRAACGSAWRWSRRTDA